MTEIGVGGPVTDSAATLGDREIALRFAGRCTGCGGEIPQGQRAVYSATTKSVRHADCSAVDVGVAGRSAMREYERRLARDQRAVEAQKDRVRERFGDGFLGKVVTLLAVDESPRRTTANWAQGAVGEERVGVRLDGFAEVGVVALHDRRIPGTRANIDHLAVTPWGVWVVDPKRYIDKRPALLVEGGLLSPRRERLRVGGRDQDKLVDGMLWQLDRVAEVVGDAAPVQGVLCFVEADWPLIGGSFTVRGVHVTWPGRLAKTLL
jgi:hypothetical protein